MLLTLTCTGPDATDLSWLLHKRPDRFQAFDLGYGTAFVFFPEYSQDSCKACLLLEVKPENLNDLCKAKDGEFQYVNPRQFLSSSLLAGALAKAYSSALRGECRDKPNLPDKPQDLEIRICNFSCRINQIYIAKIFAPLGYQVEWENFSQGGDYPAGGFAYGDLGLRIHGPLRDTLSHLYILFPVFDRQTHFWLGESQLQKFIRHSQNWLGSHPEKRLIINEYFGPAADLKYRALEYFGALRGQSATLLSPTLNQTRQAAIEAILASSGARTVIDLGCGDGSLLFLLHEQNRYVKLAGMDASAKNIENARKKLASPSPQQENPIEFFVGSLTYRDKRISGYDAATLSEVIEHFEQERMNAVMKNILGEGRPKLFIMTTPNKAYNREFLFLESEGFRHPDHRHEFDEDEFIEFCGKHAARFGYEVEISSIGGKLPDACSPTLMGVFKKCA